MQRKRSVSNSGSTVGDAEAEKLERILRTRSEARESHRAAHRLFTHVRRAAGGKHGGGESNTLSIDETLLFAVLQDAGFAHMPGGCNPNRHVFELLTKRGRNWWKKRSTALRASLLK
jgi:hypothetical protein